MRAHVFSDLLYQRMAEKGLGGKEITCNGGFQVITDIEWCEECNQFHIVTEPTDVAKELFQDVEKLGVKDVKKLAILERSLRELNVEEKE